MAAVKLSNRVVEVGGYPVRYKVGGSGDPVVLVHGLSGSTFWWTRNVPALVECYTVYLVDLPGFGSMHHSSQHLMLSEAASWLYSWMKAIGITRTHIIGHSMGGCISIRFAARYPEMVRRLVLVAPAGIPTVKTVYGYFVPLMRALRYMRPSFLPILTYDALRSGPAALLRATRDLLTQDIRNDLATLQAPTLLIWGENDTLVPPTLAGVICNALPDARLLMVKKAGHVVMFDQPQECNEAILSFLAS
ncbi:MAG TPA: alpha/beta fold hydrolase [Ktedonobacteraceae bacterium]|nr:alpha/beta fold hydrolase [Ktedonobacteraceae bacterium]